MGVKPSVMKFWLHVCVIMMSLLNAPTNQAANRHSTSDDRFSSSHQQRPIIDGFKSIPNKRAITPSIFNRALKDSFLSRWRNSKITQLFRRQLKRTHENSEMYPRFREGYVLDEKEITEDFRRTVNNDRIEVSAKNKVRRNKLDIGTKKTDVGKEIKTKRDLSAMIIPEKTDVKFEKRIKRRRQKRQTAELKETALISRTRCSHVTNYYDHRWMLMVVKCPDDWVDLTYALYCESWHYIKSPDHLSDMTLLPVQDDQGRVYANAYCAICNRVKPIHPWHVTLDCSSRLPPRDVTSFSSSKPFRQRVEFPAMEGEFGNLPMPTQCELSVVPWKQAKIVECSSLLADKNLFFRNYHEYNMADGTSFPVSFNMLLNFDFTGNAQSLFSATQEVVYSPGGQMCKDSETYDSYRDQCRPIKCSDSHTLQDGKCVAKEDSGDTLEWSYEKIDQLHLLEELVTIKLTANITYGDYLIFKMEGTSDSNLIDQLADQLQITTNRISQFNISFEEGTVNDSAIQISKVTNEQFKRLNLRNNDGEHLADDEEIDAIDHDSSDSSDSDSTGGDTAGTNPGTDPGKFKRDAGHFSPSGILVKGPIRLDNSNSGPPLSTKWKMTTDSSTLSNSAVHTIPEAVFRKKSTIELLSSKTTVKKSALSAKNNHRTTSPMKTSPSQGDETKRSLIKARLYRGETKVSEINQTKTQKNKNNNQRVTSKADKVILIDSGFYEAKALTSNSKKGDSEDLKSKTPTSPNNAIRILEPSSFWHKVSPERIKDDIFFPQRPESHQNSTSDAASNGPPGEASSSEEVLESDTNDNDDPNVNAYFSSPVNEKNERLIVRTKSTGSIPEVNLDQPMVMQITFVLMPSKHPNEEKSDELARKITQLVFEKQLHLQVEGKDISVVDSQHADEAKSDDTPQATFCPWGLKDIVYNNDFSIVSNGNETFLYVNKTDTYNPIGKFDLWIEYEGSKRENLTKLKEVEQYAYICLMPQIEQHDCRRIHLIPEEYEVVTPNKSIIFEEREYDFLSYEVLNETSGDIAICVPQGYDKYENRSGNLLTIENGCGSEFIDVMRADGYLTLILGRLSVVALFSVFITYFLFKKLRNLPGYDTINLTLALLVAQIVFTEGIVSTTPWLCSAVAITEHYTRLAAQFWMNVISYDVYRTFANPTRSTQFREKRRQFLKHFLYAWGVPLLIVGMCAVIDYTPIFPGVSIGYGGTRSMSSKNKNTHAQNATLASVRNGSGEGVDSAEFSRNGTDTLIKDESKSNSTVLSLPYMESTCWIGNSLANFIAFGAPIFLILVVNCFFFVRTIINISRTTKDNKTRLAPKHSDSSVTKNTTKRADVMLYIRMSTVMGLTWVFGFIWSIVSSFAEVRTKTMCIVVLSQGIVSTIFNVSQGIFIFVAFVCNRRVLSLYLGLFGRVKGKVPSRNSQTRLNTVSESLSTASSSLGSSNRSSNLY